METVLDLNALSLWQTSHIKEGQRGSKVNASPSVMMALPSHSKWLEQQIRIGNCLYSKQQMSFKEVSSYLPSTYRHHRTCLVHSLTRQDGHRHRLCLHSMGIN